MMNPRDNHFLLTLAALPPGSTYGFETSGPDPIEGFLINWQGQIHAYKNACPHTGVNLNWSAHQFLDIEERFIQCATHGALFEPDSGLCLRGPCLGCSLTRLPIRVSEGRIYLLRSEKC